MGIAHLVGGGLGADADTQVHIGLGGRACTTGCRVGRIPRSAIDGHRAVDAAGAVGYAQVGAGRVDIGHGRVHGHGTLTAVIGTGRGTGLRSGGNDGVGRIAHGHNRIGPHLGDHGSGVGTCCCPLHHSNDKGVWITDLVCGAARGEA